VPHSVAMIALGVSLWRTTSAEPAPADVLIPTQRDTSATEAGAPPSPTATPSPRA
jgi:hypothetical protein